VTGQRQNFQVAALFSQVWWFPNFTATYAVMNNDLAAVLAGHKTVKQMLADVAEALKG